MPNPPEKKNAPPAKPAPAKATPGAKAPPRPAGKGAKQAPRRRDRVRQSPSRKAMRQVGRTLKAGSATTVLYTKKAMGVFNAFTQSPQTNVNIEQTVLQRVVRFFQAMTFPMFLLLSAAVVAISMMAFSNSTLSVDKQELSIVGLPKELEGYTVLLLSDMHAREFGSRQGVLARTIGNEKYDLAIFAGDMVGSSGNAQPFYDLLEALPQSKPKFFVSGDSDPPPLLKEVRQTENLTLPDMVLADWVLGAQQRGATYLAHTTPVKVSSQTLWLSPINMLGINLSENIKALEAQVELEKAGVVDGIISDRNALPLSTWRYNQMLLTQQASGAMQQGDIHLALSHIPPPADYMGVTQKLGQETTVAYLPTVDLVLSGHYCGGVWRLPFYGAVYIPNSLYPRHGWFPAQTDVQGQKPLGLATLYTTAGLGVTDKVFLPNFRLLNPPQITLLTLTAKITDNLLGD